MNAASQTGSSMTDWQSVIDEQYMDFVIPELLYIRAAIKKKFARHFTGGADLGRIFKKKFGSGKVRQDRRWVRLTVARCRAPLSI